MWREAGLRWKDFLPEDVDVNKFVTEKVRGCYQWHVTHVAGYFQNLILPLLFFSKMHT